MHPRLTGSPLLSANRTIVAHPCVRDRPVILSCALALVGLPLNILLFKILISNFRLRLPRHKVLLSLTISDCLQISLVALIQLMALLAQLKTLDVSCQILRKLVEFFAILTVVTSSGSIIALSLERYVACVNCFRLYDLVSHRRVVGGLSLLWVFAVVCSLSDKKRYQSNLTPNILPLSRTTSVLYGSVILFSTVVLAYVQIKLYLTARRLIRVHPGGSFGRNAEAHDLRRSQLKASIVSSAVVVLYMVCMCPLAVYLLVTAFKELDMRSDTRLVCIFLAQVNTFFDPFLYGLGMQDTRQSLKRDLKKAKSFFQNICNQINVFIQS